MGLIHLDGNYLAARVAHQALGFSGVVIFTQVGEDDIRPFTGIGDGHSPTNAAVSAGNQRRQTFQFAATHIGFFTVIGPWLHRLSVPRQVLRLWGVFRSGVEAAGVLQYRLLSRCHIAYLHFCTAEPGPEAGGFEWVVRFFDTETDVSSPSLDINASI